MFNHYCRIRRAGVSRGSGYPTMRPAGSPVFRRRRRSICSPAPTRSPGPPLQGPHPLRDPECKIGVLHGGLRLLRPILPSSDGYPPVRSRIGGGDGGGRPGAPQGRREPLFHGDERFDADGDGNCHGLPGGAPHRRGDRPQGVLLRGHPDGGEGQAVAGKRRLRVSPQPGDGPEFLRSGLHDPRL